MRVNLNEHHNALDIIKNDSSNPHQIDILLNQLDVLKVSDNNTRNTQGLSNEVKKQNYTLLPSQTPGKSYYALEPLDDLHELNQEFKVNRGQYQKNELHINKPKNFMMKHVDHFHQKSFLINDLKHLTVGEQRFIENQKLREEAKARLESSLALQQQRNMQTDYLNSIPQRSAFMRAQHIKSKLDKHMKDQDEISKKQYKLPNLSSIVSRNCNIIDNNDLVYPVEEKLQNHSQIVKKPYSVQQMLLYRGQKDGDKSHSKLLSMKLPLQLKNIASEKDNHYQLQISRNLKQSLVDTKSERSMKEYQPQDDKSFDYYYNDVRFITREDRAKHNFDATYHKY